MGNPVPGGFFQVQARGGGLSWVCVAQGWGSECLCPKFMAAVRSVPGRPGQQAAETQQPDQNAYCGGTGGLSPGFSI